MSCSSIPIDKINTVCLSLHFQSMCLVLPWKAKKHIFTTFAIKTSIIFTFKCTGTWKIAVKGDICAYLSSWIRCFILLLQNCFSIKINNNNAPQSLNIAPLSVIWSKRVETVLLFTLYTSTIPAVTMIWLCCVTQHKTLLVLIVLFNH